MWWITALLAGFGAAGAAATGFYGDWVLGRPTGWGLIAHMAFAGGAMVGFTMWAVRGAGAHCIDAAARRTGAVEILRRSLFWLLLLFALASMTTMLSAMLPVFGYIGQDWLTEWHERSGMGIVVAGALYLVLSAVVRLAGGEKKDVS
ncbi:MAG: hypothetical protein HRF50_04780 [Phycisphaerae bacterium]|jgi:hypothetical protein